MSGAYPQERLLNVPVARALPRERCASCGLPLCARCLWREDGESYCRSHVPLPSCFKGDLSSVPRSRTSGALRSAAERCDHV